MIKKFFSPISVIYAYIIVMAMNISIVEIFCQTYMLVFDLKFFISNIAVMVAIIAILNSVRLKRFPLIAFVLMGLGSIYFIYNRTDLMACFRKIIMAVRAMSFYQNQSLNNSTNVPSASLAECWSLIVVIPSYFLTLSLIRRLNIFIGLSWYIALFSVTVLLNYSFAYWYWYVIFVACCLFVILFGFIRKYESKVIDRIMLTMFIPVVVVAFIPALIFPMDAHDFKKASNQLDSIAITIDRLANTNLVDAIKGRVFDKDDTGLKGDINKVRPVTDVVSFIVSQNGSIATSQDNLSNQGAFIPINASIMEIKLNIYDEEYADSFSGRNFYLLSSAMGFFDGNSWMRGSAPSFTEESFESVPIYVPASLSIKTHNIWDSVIVPNYAGTIHVPSDFVPSLGGEMIAPNSVDYYFAYEYCENTAANNTYEWALNTPSNCNPMPEVSEEYKSYIDSVCTHVPEEIELYILDNVELPEWYIDAYNGYSSYSDQELTELVMNYVYSTHTYNQATTYPGNKEAHDFVSWFLSESETGYCVHFASATAVLLRMLNIPTRYCLGYEVNFVQPDKTITVFDTDAHAWCEVWLDEYGWVQIDPTSNTFVNGPRFEKANSIDVERPRSTPTPTPYPNGVSMIEVEDGEVTMIVRNEFGKETVYYVKHDDMIAFDLASNNAKYNNPSEIVLLVIILIVVILVIYRIIYTAIWKHKFKNPDRNMASRAYGRYYYRFVRFYKIDKDEAIVKLVDKAMYSREGVNEKEYKEISSKVMKKVDRLIAGSGVIKKCFVTLWLKV